MPTYGIFEDDVLITGGFTDLGSAEDIAERYKDDPGMIYGTLEALEICPVHDYHSLGTCTVEGNADNAMLQQVIDGLRRTL